MKKNIIIGILVILVFTSFLLGKNIDSIFDLEENSIDHIVGVYETSSWNGDTAILCLYDDGTCQYPTGSSGSWELNENQIIITLIGTKYDNGYRTITAYLDNSLSEAEAKSISQTIASHTNVESVNLLSDDHQQRIYIKLVNEDTNNELYNFVDAIDGVKSVEYEYREVTDYSTHEATIMENGIVLHGHFFIKVSG